jgi:hypothetical protein
MGSSGVETEAEISNASEQLITFPPPVFQQRLQNVASTWFWLTLFQLMNKSWAALHSDKYFAIFSSFSLYFSLQKSSFVNYFSPFNCFKKQLEIVWCSWNL